MNPEQLRLEEDRLRAQPWRKWGPYLSDRQWGTVREDYSGDGDAWTYFPHDMARQRAYRWGEDGLAGFSDSHQHLCMAVALWNGHDPFLKERLFGLTNPQGNHGEDVKELYWYLDATPTHSYQRMLYKYPQRPFPYEQLIEENQRRDRKQPEFELLDTGIFNDDRYFDVFVEYAKAGPEALLLQVTAHNRGPEPAVLHLLPQVWFRNTWSWTAETDKPVLSVHGENLMAARHPRVGVYEIHADQPERLLFCDNESNPKLWKQNGAQGYFKDAFHEYVVHGNHGAVNPRERGTKAAAYYLFTIDAGGSARVRLRLSKDAVDPFTDFDRILQLRRDEADQFYAGLQKGITSDDARAVHRQALSGLLWNKQYYRYNLPLWLKGDPAMPPPPPQHSGGRNAEWQHIDAGEVLSMPDKWEYPWFAAWDLAFHAIGLALVDPELAKEQLVILTREWYMHPNGQLPAYEWEFRDVNPPVHAWAAWRVFQIDRKHCGRGPKYEGDLAFLERIFHKLLLNFTWWVNRKDAEGRNVFQGGFLGMDNIGILDRSKVWPGLGRINQADGSAWMAMFCLNMLRIALELAHYNHAYEDIASKFFEHFLQMALAITNMGGPNSGVGLWDEEDQFYYDELNFADGQMFRLKVRSMVGLVPLFAVEILEPETARRLPGFGERLEWYLTHRPDLAGLVSRWHEPGRGYRGMLSLLRGHRMKRLLKRMLDQTEFLSDFGVRSLSRYHADHPYQLHLDGNVLSVGYEPGESQSSLFGGNSNWRGPIWMPVNYLLVESLQKFHHYYGDDFKVECPTGSGKFLTILEVAEELTCRLTRLFLRDEHGRRPIFGACEKMQSDPYFRDYLLFHEYFDGETGAGLGASHQTGWTALIAKLLQPRRPDHLPEEYREVTCPAAARAAAARLREQVATGL
jgi:hypothetical protein